MSVFSYRTIESPSVGDYREKGSKFLAFAFPVENEQQIKDHLDMLKKEYFDARHHCFAFVLGVDKKRFRAFDDGEPNHSAGDPILGQIRSKELTDTLVIVVRYFGGIKLGVGGLINAYKAAAGDALSNAAVIEKDVLKNITISYDYGATPEVMRLIKAFDLIIKEQSFEDRCVLSADYKLQTENEVLKKINLLIATGHPIEIRK